MPAGKLRIEDAADGRRDAGDSGRTLMTSAVPSATATGLDGPALTAPTLPLIRVPGMWPEWSRRKSLAIAAWEDEHVALAASSCIMQDHRRRKTLSISLPAHGLLRCAAYMLS